MHPARPSDPGTPGDISRDRLNWLIARPYVLTAITLIAGLALGRAAPHALVWMGVAAAGLLATCAALAWKRPRLTAAMLIVTGLGLAAAYHVLAVEHVRGDHIAHHVTDGRQLAQVTGRVVGELSHPPRDETGLLRYSYRPDVTLFELDVDGVTIAGERRSASGTLSVRINQHEHRLRHGQRIAATGWLYEVAPPGNPGAFDYRAYLAGRGIPGQLSLPSVRHWRWLDDAPGTGLVAGLAGPRLRDARYALRHAMLDGLRAGMSPGPPLELLEALLLGQRGDSFRDTYDLFRNTGLAHLMAISGAHLAVLLGIVWALARLTGARPSTCAVIVLVSLLVYAFALPGRVPILRASTMAAAFCIAWAMGRAMPALALLAIAAIGVLLWRPEDVASPGFQLSFGIVAMLILFTRRVSTALWPLREAEHSPPMPWRWLIARRIADVTAVSLVAGATAVPLVAFHFELVTPWAVVLSVLAVLPFAVLLGIGYLKMVVGLVAPAASQWLAPMTEAGAGIALGLVEAAARWPGAALELARPASPLWAVGALAVVVAFFAGQFRHRVAALVAALTILTGWGVLHDRPHLLAGVARSSPALELRSFAVGHGSAHLISVDGEHILWDAGSHSFPEAGQRTIVPGLRRLGVRRLEAIFVTHAHVDHYNAIPAIIEAVEVRRVVVPPHVLELARDQPGGPVAMLIDILDEAGVPVEVATRHWRTSVGGAGMEILWPPSRDPPARVNDASLVARVRVAGRSVLMTGDIQRGAITRLLELGDDLAADVMELPHHGEHSGQAVALVHRVGPAVIVQSCSAGQYRDDRWADSLNDMAYPPARLVTSRDGKATVTIERDGHLRWRGFRGRAGAEALEVAE